MTTATPTLRRVPWLAQLLDLSECQTYDAIAQGNVPAECIVRVGRRIRICEESVRAWIAGELQ